MMSAAVIVFPDLLLCHDHRIAL